MNHQPFEEWLLNDKNLTNAEKHELDLHLRTCTHCTALTATGLALRSANVVAPVSGFSVRFQQRLAAQKVAERRRKLWGMVVLILAGAGLLGWFATPVIYTFLASPGRMDHSGYRLFSIRRKFPASTKGSGDGTCAHRTRFYPAIYMDGTRIRAGWTWPFVDYFNLAV